ncbi:barstar family protein [Deinococcus hopiensis]|uniref:Barstar, RNAse (Barnase) inhibitor n=1 Tax=Deinococcus hopiensis KR-140 TaxID=695939 RepID=A0A1W1VEJ1_9DEIO|nr:barstar family protein [Deinococcus hopiensis]SMB91792.1 Barstar, RNAse (barnase) inhibitor [Deinococcus hopiensis KR-140]
MIHVFAQAPQGIQTAPHDARILAAGHQVALREVDLSQVHGKESLMLAFLRGLSLSGNFGHNWDALYDVLTDSDACPARFALVLCDYGHFRTRHRHLAAPLEGVLIDAQREAAGQGRSLWLLAEEPDSDTAHW